MKTVTINQNDAGQRLDKFLQKYLNNAPQALVYKYIRKKRVKINRRRAHPDDRLLEGDVIDLYISDEFLPAAPRQTGFSNAAPPDILYEDENCLLLDKKPGLCCHAGPAGEKDSLILRVQSYLYRTGAYNPQMEHSFAPALCNRIDRNTGGIVIAAKNAPALRELNQLIRNGGVEKEYLCLCAGAFPKKQGQLVSYLRKNEANNQVTAFPTPVPGAKQARLSYEVLDEKDGLSLVRILLDTGRTHQIRVQLAGIGCPILGDGKYGNPAINRRYPYRYQALYSWRITFRTGSSQLLSALHNRTFEAPDVYFLQDWKQGRLSG